jgi:hypothetical protein
MTPIPAKVLAVEKQSSQYRVLVQIELEKYLGSFHTLRFGESKPFTGSCYHGQLDRSRCGRLCEFSAASVGDQVQVLDLICDVTLISGFPCKVRVFWWCRWFFLLTLLDLPQWIMSKLDEIRQIKRCAVLPPELSLLREKSC